jgi:hypothetical protein
METLRGIVVNELEGRAYGRIGLPVGRVACGLSFTPLESLAVRLWLCASFPFLTEVSLNEEKRRLKVEMTHDPFTAGRFFHLLQVR